MSKTHIKVLLIDPEPDMRQLNAEVLSEAGYHVEQLPENADPVAFAEQIRPQEIVISIRPRRPEDRQIVESLQTNPVTGSIPLVAISTSEEVATSLSALPNIYQTVVAPYDVTALEAAVACAVAWASANGALRNT